MRWPLVRIRRSRRTLRSGCAAAAVAWLAVGIGAPASAWAHDPGLSSLDLIGTADAVRLRAVFARADLERITTRRSAGRAFGHGAYLVCDGARELPMRTVSVGGDAETITFDLQFPRGAGVSQSAGVAGAAGVAEPNGAADSTVAEACEGVEGIRVRALRLGDLGRGHRQRATMRVGADAGSRNMEGDRLLAESLLSAAAPDIAARAVAVAGPRTSFVRRGVDFVVLGVEHILIGYDHLAFLLALLLGGARWRDVARIITAFTVAHSLTLAAAALRLVVLPAGIVEPAIAVSIVWVGLGNLRSSPPGHRPALAFAFGLVHGFGFAGVLADLTAPGTGIVAPLLGFNIGVEIGQLGIAAIAVPALARCRRTGWFVERLSPACSLALVGAGAYWLLERTISPF